MYSQMAIQVLMKRAHASPFVTDGGPYGGGDWDDINGLQAGNVADKQTSECSTDVLATIAEEFASEAKKLANNRNQRGANDTLEYTDISDEELEALEQDFSIQAKNLNCNRKNGVEETLEYTDVTDAELADLDLEFSIEAKKLANKRNTAAGHPTDVRITCMSDDELEVIDKEFSAAARTLTNNIPSVSLSSDFELATIADEFAAEAKKLADQRRKHSRGSETSMQMTKRKFSIRSMKRTVLEGIPEETVEDFVACCDNRASVSDALKKKSARTSHENTTIGEMERLSDDTLQKVTDPFSMESRIVEKQAAENKTYAKESTSAGGHKKGKKSKLVPKSIRKLFRNLKGFIMW